MIPIIYFSIEKRKIVPLCFLFAFYIGPFFRAIVLDSDSPIKNEIKLVPYKSVLFKNDTITK